MSILKISKNEGDRNDNIVFIHGIASSSRIFHPLIESEHLAEYNKILIDLPGHGQTIYFGDNSAYSIENYKQVILEAIKNIPNVLLVGNSIGGNLSLEISDQLPNIKGIVMFASPPFKSPINPDEIFLRNEALLYFLMEEVPNEAIDSIFQLAVLNKDAIPLIREDFYSCDPRVRSVLGTELLGGNGFSDQYKAFQELSIPKYIIHGLQDPSVNGNYLQELCELSKGIAEFIPVENCGHYATVDQPEFVSLKLKEIADSVFS